MEEFDFCKHPDVSEKIWLVIMRKANERCRPLSTELSDCEKSKVLNFFKCRRLRHEVDACYKKFINVDVYSDLLNEYAKLKNQECRPLSE